MNLKKNKNNSQRISFPQTYRQNNHPFQDITRYSPYSTVENRLYNSLKESIPVIDAAINKIIRLVGDFEIVCDKKYISQDLNDFFENIPVNVSGCGIESFISIYLNQLLTYGTAVGEILLSKDRRNMMGLYNVPLENVEFATAKDSMNLIVCSNEKGKIVPVPFQNLITTSVINAEPGNLTGTSILKGLPFVSGILLNIYNSIGLNWERIGNVRFAVTYKPSSQGNDQLFARERALEIAEEWSSAMTDNGGRVNDFIAVGDVDIKVIGADNQILDSSVPVRQMLEQIVAKLGIPPFLLGLNWSTTERMSTQQVDILTSELESYRRLLAPVVLKICRVWLSLQGVSARCRVKWNNINLQDELELSKARLYNAQAKQIEILNGTEEVVDYGE